MGPHTILLSLFLCLLLNSVESHSHTQNWAYHIVLDNNGKYNLYWNPPEIRSGNSQITFRAEVQAKGCIALGFSHDGAVPGSDVVVGWIKQGEAYFQDRHTDGTSQLIKDVQQDYELIHAEENDTHTIFEFRRKLDTCDEYDMVIDESTARLIHTYSQEDPDDVGDEPFYAKEEFGSKSILLLQSNIMGDLDFNSPSLLQWDIVAPNVNVSSKDGLIWCLIVKSPDIDKKHHIVHIKPLIHPGHEEFVFHIGMYECVGGTADEFEDFIDYRGHECYHPDIPSEMMRCQGLILSWIIGGGDIMFPGHAGMPIYPGRYFLFEVNYQNPELKRGIIDTSGIRYYYTSDLRENDAGAYAIGTSISHRTIVPPGQNEYTVAGHSHRNCVFSGFPPSGGKIFGINLHSRSTGRRMKLRHFRDNKELPTLAYDNNFDPAYQEFKYYKDEITILPNDQLTRECVFNSTKRSKVTFSGMTTLHDICMGLILYYPFDGGYISHSGPSLASINRAFNTSIANDEDIAGVLESYDWEKADIKKIQDDLRYSELEAQCYYGPYREGDEPHLVSYPKDFIPYEPEDTCSGTV